MYVRVKQEQRAKQGRVEGKRRRKLYNKNHIFVILSSTSHQRCFIIITHVAHKIKKGEEGFRMVISVNNRNKKLRDGYERVKSGTRRERGIRHGWMEMRSRT